MASAKVDRNLQKVVTPVFRLSFPSIFKPKSFEGSEPKYSVVMLFDKKTDLTPMKKAVKAAIVSKWGADKAKWPKGLRMPFRDGSEKSDLDGYEGCIFVSASSKTQPGIVDQRLEEVIDQEVVYAGCYARAEVFAFPYDRAGNKGVSFGLNHIQKIKDGESFSGKGNAKNAFDAVEDEADDESFYEDDSTDEDLGF